MFGQNVGGLKLQVTRTAPATRRAGHQPASAACLRFYFQPMALRDLSRDAALELQRSNMGGGGHDDASVARASTPANADERHGA